MSSLAISRIHLKSLILSALALTLWALLMLPGPATAAQRLVVAELYSSST